jgi:hypothetical protein
VTQIQQIVSNTIPTTLTDAWFNVYEPDGITLTAKNKARSILFQSSTDSLIDLGGPIEGEFLARGARAGVDDRLCVFDLDVSPPRLGCEAVTLNDRRLELNELPATWNPEVLIDPHSITDFNIEVRNLPTGLTLQARLYLTDGTSTSILTMNENNGIYRVSFTGIQQAAGGYLHIWVNEASPRRELILDYTVGGAPGPAGGGGGHAPIVSGDGKVTLFGDLVFPEGEFYLLHTATTLPDLPPTAFAPEQGYRLSATAHAPQPTPKTVTINFDYLGFEIPAGSESNLQIYYYDDTNRDTNSRWIPLETTLNREQNYAAAQAQGEGLYALLTTYRNIFPIIFR